MSVQVFSFSPTIPAATPISANWSADMSFPPRVVDRITVTVPPGPRGNVGFSIGSAGTPIIPQNAGQWVVTDNQTLEWVLTDQHTSGAWTLYAYNVGRQPHTLYVAFDVSLPTAGLAPSGLTLIQPSALAIGP